MRSSLVGYGLTAVLIGGTTACGTAGIRVIERRPDGGTILVGDHAATLQRIRQECGGDFVVVGEREVITSRRGASPDDAPALIAVLRIAAGGEEHSDELTTAWAYDYRCSGPRMPKEPPRQRVVRKPPAEPPPLEWQSYLDPLPLTWEQAAIYCNRLPTDDEYRPWRVPSHEEVAELPEVEGRNRPLWVRGEESGEPVPWQVAPDGNVHAAPDAQHAAVLCVR